jgi:hypothetical protein
MQENINEEIGIFSNLPAGSDQKMVMQATSTSCIP